MDVGEHAETVGETQSVPLLVRSVEVNMMTLKEKWVLSRQSRKRVRQEPS